MNATQLSMDEALAARDAALDRVEAAADAEWLEDARFTVYSVCFNHSVFTSETIWDHIEKPREPRALGPILKHAVKQGWCEPVGFVTSSMTSRHAAPVRQYRSLLSRGVGSPSTALLASQPDTYRGATAEATAGLQSPPPASSFTGRRRD